MKPWLVILVCPLALGCENTPPEIVDMTRLTDTSSEIGPYEVFATVVDDLRVDAVELHYRVDGGEFVPLQMDDLGQIFVGSIPGQPAGSTLDYFLVARDGDGAETAYPLAPSTGGGAIPLAHTFKVVAPP